MQQWQAIKAPKGRPLKRDVQDGRRHSLPEARQHSSPAQLLRPLLSNGATVLKRDSNAARMNDRAAVSEEFFFFLNRIIYCFFVIKKKRKE